VTLDALMSLLGDIVEDEVLVTARTLGADGAPPILWANPALLRNTGWRLEDLQGRPIDVLFGPQTDRAVMRRMSKGLLEGRTVRETLVTYRRDGTSYWIDALVQIVDLPGSAAAVQVAVRRDVTDLVSLRDELDRTRDDADALRRRLWGAIEALPHAFVIYDSDDRLVMCNARYRETYALSAPAIFPGARFEDVLRYGLDHGQYPEALGREEAWFADRMARHRDPPGPITQVLAGDVHLQVHEERTRWGDTVGFRIDLTELVRQRREIERQSRVLAAAIEQSETRARTDALTGLANRRGLDLHLRGLMLERASTVASSRDAHPAEQERRVPEAGGQMAVLHVDLDRFKQINDMFGHAAGDHVLCAVAGILRRAVRPTDCVARLGGDEFAVVLRAGDAEAAAQETAGRIIAACAEPVVFEERVCRYGCSVGIAVAADGAVDTLTEDADIALYEAKRGGRNRAALFTPALRAAAQERKTLADDLLRGLAAGELVVHFHPQVEAATGRLHGVEALARWQHPVRGLLMPGTFLPIADDLGLTSEIDARVLRQSLGVISALAAEGVVVPKVSVNASYRRLASEQLRAEIRAMTPPPCRLAFELLETIAFDEQNDAFFWTLDALREQGIEIELDDFGSGHASITTLLRLRPGRIKIDRQLVAALGSEVPEAEVLISAICDMARAMDIRLTAEGVETEDQAATLRRLGCDVLQGFLFARPLAAEALRAWISARQDAGAVPSPDPAGLGSHR